MTQLLKSFLRKEESERTAEEYLPSWQQEGLDRANGMELRSQENDLPADFKQDSKSAVQSKGKPLPQKLDSLAEEFLELGYRMVRVGGHLRESGLPASENLITILAGAMRDLAAFFARVVESVQGLSGSSEKESARSLYGEDLGRAARQILAACERLYPVAEAALSVPESLEMEDLARADAIGDEAVNIKQQPHPSIPDDLAVELEALLEEVINEVSRAKKTAEASSRAAEIISIPQEPKALVAEVPCPGPATPPAQQAEPLPMKAFAPRRISPLTPVQEHRGPETHAQSVEPDRSSAMVSEKEVGRKQPETADTLGELALVHYKEGRYSEAAALYERALFVCKGSLGSDHPAVATCLHNLAVVYVRMGRQTAAQIHWKDSLAIVERAFGARHPKAALRIADLADLLYLEGDLEQAEQLYGRLLEILENSSGGERPNLHASLTNYLGLLRRVHRRSEARKLEGRIRVLLMSERVKS